MSSCDIDIAADTPDFLLTLHSLEDLEQQQQQHEVPFSRKKKSEAPRGIPLDIKFLLYMLWVAFVYFILEEWAA